MHILSLRHGFEADHSSSSYEFFALDNTCTYQGGPLAEGELAGHEVTCPWHGATFDVRTGEVVEPPAQRAVARYEVRVTGTDIEVEL